MIYGHSKYDHRGDYKFFLKKNGDYLTPSMIILYQLNQQAFLPPKKNITHVSLV